MVYTLAVDTVLLNKIINKRHMEKIKVNGKKKQALNLCCLVWFTLIGCGSSQNILF